MKFRKRTNNQLAVFAYCAFILISPSSGRCQGVRIHLGLVHAGASAVGVVQGARATPSQDDSFFKPVDIGPGVVICEPVGKGTDGKTSDFGFGCGLWLQWSIGRNLSLGQTPRFRDFLYVTKEQKLSNLALDITQASILNTRVGANRAAIGTISPERNGITISYQMYELPSKRLLGSPVIIHGSRDQIVAQLPAAAAALVRAIGVREPVVEPLNGITPDELELLGRYHWLTPRKPDDANQMQIDQIAPHCVLAALLNYVRTTDYANRKDDAARATQLLQADQDNLITIGQVVASSNYTTQPLQSLLEASLSRFPENAPARILHTITLGGKWDKLVPECEKLVKVLPGCPYYWDMLAAYYKEQASYIRGGRVASAITREEWDHIGMIYRRQQYAMEKTVSLDPLYPGAWYDLAVAATFNSDPQRADAAFWKSISTDGPTASTLSWGLEMYQRKWGGDPKTLVKVADLAAGAPLKTPAELHQIAGELSSAGFRAQAQTLYSRAIESVNALVHEHPQDAATHATHGFYLTEQGRYDEAIPELQMALKLNPNSDVANFQLGNVYSAQNKPEQAIPYYRVSVRLTRGYEARRRLAAVLASTGNVDEGELIIREVIKDFPSQWRPYYQLGWMYIQRKQYESALVALKRAQELGPENQSPYIQLSFVYLALNKPDLALEQATTAVQISPNVAEARRCLAYAYRGNNDMVKAIRQFRAACDLAPTNPQMRLELGAALVNNDKRQEGRSELMKILTMKDAGEIKSKAEELLRQFP